MDAIVYALKEELKQASKLIQRYRKELKELFIGSFFTRKIGKNTYGYITQSIDGRVQQQYLGKLKLDEIKEYKDQTARKKKLARLCKQAETQKDFLEKAIRHAR
ncbi:MAG: hypothetical protein ABII18_06860 [bacterium]|nr:hypothetical protein [bacterium]MBU1916838.1 hypothetical protein [bacterium]